MDNDLLYEARARVLADLQAQHRATAAAVSVLEDAVSNRKWWAEQWPEGEVYVAVESPRGELGCYLVSDGSGKPYRMHIRGPSCVNLQTLPHLMADSLIADTVAIISSVDPIMGEVDR